METTIDNNLSQRLRFASEFKKIEKDVTPRDRDIVMIALNLTSRSTVSKYLKGNPRNNDLAAKMLTILKECIADREKAINGN